jgi:hypothetical protein
MAIPPLDARRAAESVAIQALGFIAAEPARLGRFLADTGLGPATLRTAASDPAFLAGVLDFVLRDEALVKDFSTHADLPPATVSAAHDALAGPRWEHDQP